MLLTGFLQFHDLLLSEVDLVLVLLNLVLRLLEHFFLVVGHIIQLLSHFLDLLGLSVVDIALASDLFLTGLDVGGGVFVFFGQLLVVFATLGKLDLNVSE